MQSQDFHPNRSHTIMIGHSASETKSQRGQNRILRQQFVAKTQSYSMMADETHHPESLQTVFIEQVVAVWVDINP